MLDTVRSHGAVSVRIMLRVAWSRASCLCGRTRPLFTVIPEAPMKDSTTTALSYAQPRLSQEMSAVARLAAAALPTWRHAVPEPSTTHSPPARPSRSWAKTVPYSPLRTPATT